jgi:hypothetical protein
LYLAVVAVCCEPVPENFPCSRQISREFSQFLVSHGTIQLHPTVPACFRRAFPTGFPDIFEDLQLHLRHQEDQAAAGQLLKRQGKPLDPLKIPENNRKLPKMNVNWNDAVTPG